MPPPVLNAYKTSEENSNTNALGGLVRQAIRNHDQETEDDDDDEDSEDSSFSTDATFELMTQLRDVLAISISQGWKIFEDRKVTF